MLRKYKGGYGEPYGPKVGSHPKSNTKRIHVRITIQALTQRGVSLKQNPSDLIIITLNINTFEIAVPSTLS